MTNEIMKKTMANHKHVHKIMLNWAEFEGDISFPKTIFLSQWFIPSQCPIQIVAEQTETKKLSMELKLGEEEIMWNYNIGTIF